MWGWGAFLASAKALGLEQQEVDGAGVAGPPGKELDFYLEEMGSQEDSE